MRDACKIQIRITRPGLVHIFYLSKVYAFLENQRAAMTGKSQPFPETESRLLPVFFACHDNRLERTDSKLSARSFSGFIAKSTALHCHSRAAR